MRLKCIIIFICILSMLTGSCAKYALVTYGDVERTNSVEITLISGGRITGTVYKIEPHQLTILDKSRRLHAVAKTSIRSIKRKPPIYDDFGKGISEEEIKSEKTSKNKVLYGVGGGLLSFGVSFFMGSMISKSMEENSETALAATTAVGGGLGTVLFIRAGNSKDRKEAIERIRAKRRSVELQKGDGDNNKISDDLHEQLDAERKKQEELRKKREELLRQLEGKKKKKDIDS